MDDLRTRAQLVAFDPARAGTIGTILSRAEIAETAAQGEFPATLLLDLDRAEAPDGGDSTAHARITVDWDEETLEQLLASTDEDEIALWFDERELASAFDDVEGHGLREKAAVLAVAAAAAGATAGSALAGQVGPAGPMGAVRGLPQDKQLSASVTPTPTPSTAGQPMGAQRGLQQDEQLSPTGTTTSVTPSGGDSSMPTGEIAGIAGAAGVLLISAAGFGVARKRTRPAQPA